MLSFKTYTHDFKYFATTIPQNYDFSKMWKHPDSFLSHCTVAIVATAYYSSLIAATIKEYSNYKCSSDFIQLSTLQFSKKKGSLLPGLTRMYGSLATD